MGFRFIFYLVLFLFSNLFSKEFPILIASVDSPKENIYTSIFNDITKSSFDMSEDGYYVILNGYEKMNYANSRIQTHGGFAIAYISKKDDTQIFYVPAIPFIPGPENSKWFDCNKKLIHNRLDLIKKYCKKEYSISRNLRKKFDDFFKIKRMSIIDDKKTGHLFIVQKRNKKFYRFEMISPKSYNHYLENNSFFSDYTDLFFSIEKIMLQNFENCNWSKFDNASSILEQCKIHDGILFEDDILTQLKKGSM